MIAAYLVTAAGTTRQLSAQVQGAAPGPTTTHRYPEVVVDRNSSAINAVLPFDESFIMSGTAAASLQRIDVWYGAAATLPKANCSTIGQKLPDETGEQLKAGIGHSRWRREGPATTFWIRIGALKPNEDLTFCFEAVDALSTADSLAFVTKAAAGIRRKLIGLQPDTTGSISDTALHELHAMLRAALPKVDSVDTPKGSLLGALPKDTAALRVFNGRLFDMFLALKQPYATRLNAARKLEENASSDQHRFDARGKQRNLPAERPGPPTPLCDPDELEATHDTCDQPLGWLLRQLGHDPSLSSLSRAERALARPGKAGTAGLSQVEADQIHTAARLTRRITGALGALNGLQAQAIAAGMLVITDPGSPDVNANFEEQWSATTLAARAANLDTTIVRLGDLHQLVAFAYNDPVAFQEVGLDTASLVDLDRRILTVHASAVGQRVNFRFMLAAINDLDKTIEDIVSELAVRDLSRSGLFSSTSANYEARARSYVGQEIGVIYGWRGKDVRQASPYLGLNVYLVPVNKRAKKPVLCLIDARCHSVSIGVSTNTWETEDRFTGIIAGRPLILGAGTRIGDYFRVSYNRALVYRYEFLTDGERHRHLDSIGSISVALDADLRDIISGLANAIFPK